MRMLKTSILSAALAVVVAASWSASMAGQSAPAQRSAAPARTAAAHRTPDGQPDLQGLYDLATLTPLERPAAFGNTLSLTEDQAKKLEQAVADRIERLAQPSDGNRAAPPIGGDGSRGAAGNVGGYNNFWIDSGTRYTVVDGQKRTSI